MDMTIKIEAPALVDAINSLAVAIAGNMELLLNNRMESIPETIIPAQPAPPVQQIQQAPVQQAPTTVPTYNMEQLAVAATQLVDAGRRNDLVGLLSQFGVQALTSLPKEQYGNFATHLRAMGAKI